MIIYTIYKCVNTINGKVYVGFDSQWPNRQKIHKSNHKKVCYKFYNAILKYGWENFEWTIIYQSKDREHTLKTMEPQFIKEYDSFKNGYNSTLGGEGVFGLKRKFSKEEIENKRKFMLGNQIGKANKGKFFSEERKQKLRKPKNLITRTCPHCFFVGSGSNMFRYHFNKCKKINP
jgi:group I intron endonuclease